MQRSTTHIAETINGIPGSVILTSSGGTISITNPSSGVIDFETTATPVGPAGTNTDIQVNDMGAFGAYSTFTYDGTTFTAGATTITNGNLIFNTPGAYSFRLAQGVSAYGAVTLFNNTDVGNQTDHSWILDRAGNFGVGVVPSYKLDVDGDARATNIITPSINIATSSNFSIGNGAAASGGSALAFGDGASATALAATAIGPEDSNFGSGASANGEGSIAIGINSYTDAGNPLGISIGFGASSFGNAAVAIGPSAQAFGDNSVCSGLGAITFGAGSIACGSSVTANNDYSYAFGSNVSTGANGSMIFGAIDAGAVFTGAEIGGTSSIAFVMTPRSSTLSANKTMMVLGGSFIVDPRSSGNITAARCDIDFGFSTNAMLSPSGTIAQRPTGVNGMQRYNSDKNTLEAYVNGSWNTLATGIIGVVTNGDLLAQTAAVSSIMAVYTTPNDGTTHTFRVNAYTAITAISAGTLTVQVSFTDENNTSRTISYFPMGLTSAGLTSTGFDAFTPCNIRCKPNTAITLLTTFTGVSITYDVGGYAELIY